MEREKEKDKKERKNRNEQGFFVSLEMEKNGNKKKKLEERMGLKRPWWTGIPEMERERKRQEKKETMFLP